MWQKFIAAACVMTGTIGFGWSLCREMNCEIQQLKSQKQILLYMIGEITYLHRPVEEILDIISEKINRPYDTFIANISEKMQERNGKSFSEIWHNEIISLKKREEMSHMVTIYLEKLGECFGCEQDEMQVEALRLFEKELDLSIEEKSAKREENSRLIKVLSTLTGILCIVLFF